MSCCLHPPPEQTTLFVAHDYISGDRFTVERCLRCGLGRTRPIPVEPAQYYPSGYYGRGKRYARLMEWLLDWLYSHRAAQLEQQSIGRPGNALDIGCGRGQILDQLRRRGWNVSGTEMTEESGWYAREVLGLPVYIGDLANLSLPSASFDLIILWHVLEHVADPGALLREVGRLLRPNGMALIAIPNFGSPEARWGRQHWFHLDVPRHLSHFDRSALGYLLEEVALRPERVGYFAPEYDLFSAVQTFLNTVGIRHNLLYNLLRSRGARPLEEEIDVGGTVLTLVLLPTVSVLAALWTTFAGIARLGATITVLARKQP